MLHYRRGTGNLRPVTSNDPDDFAQAAWDAWARECGYLHQYGSYTSQMMRARQHLVMEGEVFIQRVIVNNSKHVNGLLLQVWPGRYRDRGKQSLGGKGTRIIIDGLEFAGGLPTAVWMVSQNTQPDFWGGGAIRIPFDDLVWLRYAPEADQIDGLPVMHAAIASDAQLADYAETALIQSRVAACMSAMIMAEPHHLSTDILNLGTRVTDAEGNVIEELTPGSFAIVHGAKGVTSIEPKANHFPVEHQNARVFAGQGLTAEVAGGAAGGASYSGLRWAITQRDEAVEEFSRLSDWLVGMQRVLGWFVEAEMLAGRDHSQVVFQWLPGRKSAIDPEKEANADKIRIESGVKSKREVILQSGRDPEQVFQEIEDEQARIGSEETDSDNPDQRQIRMFAGGKQ